MLADTLSITYNAVAVTLNKIREQNFTSTYFAESSAGKFTLDVKHTIPPQGGTGESHLVKLTVEYFDANNVYQKSVSPWVVIKTFDGAQNATDALRASKALVGLLSDAFLTQVIGRMS
jgi:subtilisin-like proprotein convertase family protein